MAPVGSGRIVVRGNPSHGVAFWRQERDMRRIGLIGLLATLLVSSGCATIEANRFKARLKGKPALDFTLTSLDGDRVTLSEFRGKPMILAFFAFG